jgi:hypothetical protein
MLGCRPRSTAPGMPAAPSVGGGCGGTSAPCPAPRSTSSRPSTSAWTPRCVTPPWISLCSQFAPLPQRNHHLLDLAIGGWELLRCSGSGGWFSRSRKWLTPCVSLALLGAAELQGEPVQGLLVRPQREDHRPPPRRPLLHHLPPGDAN